ncbi:hypothetical protein WJ0W_006513 [Paenibacillus melissococcoides]|uniref:Uncharacterized protein n=1 Tax=Paenibacillus melissococcoides TaxID=2912268 RepID=A0ABN8UDM7_9BACL|nr:hypothetical protein [Paenibacillus melissococcoides]CAH8249327.1 hypothetical protein WJ0W_006513 [Paenibacillus melissococcoides]
MNFRLDSTGDLIFADGELQMVSGPEEIAQAARVVLGTNLDEWFLDPMQAQAMMCCCRSSRTKRGDSRNGLFSP